jgi:hypothetical protein
MALFAPGWLRWAGCIVLPAPGCFYAPRPPEAGARAGSSLEGFEWWVAKPMGGARMVDRFQSEMGLDLVYPTHPHAPVFRRRVFDGLRNTCQSLFQAIQSQNTW